MTDYCMFEIMFSDMEKNKEYERILSNLLAILNRDGGHYQHEHGLVKAVMNAIENFNKAKFLLDETK